MRARAVTLIAILTATVLAGCTGPPELADEDDPPFLDEPRLVWDDNFTVHDGATRIYANLTLVRADANMTEATLRLLGPANATVEERTVTWNRSLMHAPVRLVVTDPAPGEWSYTVHAVDAVQVDAEIRVVNPENGSIEV